MRLEPLDEVQIESIVSKAIEDAQDFIDSEVAPQRIKAQRYFDGEVDIGYEEGRSRVVATKCREVVRGMKPSIQRIFLSNEKPVEFVPRGPEDVAMAEQATQFVSYKFQQHNGYRILSDVFQDAMVKKAGIAYVYHREEMETEIHTFTNLTEEAFALLVEDDDVEVIEHEARMTISMDEMGMEVEMPEHDVKIARSIPHGDVCIESIPPEDFFVDRNARSMDSYYIVGHSTEMTVGELLSMGFSLDDLAGLDGSEYSTTQDEAEFERRGYTVDEADDENISGASKKITVTSAYMELDIEGTGQTKLYQFLCAGTSYKLLNFYEADYAPYAIFECDPEPHAFFGTSLVDLVMDDQDAATAMLRGVLDNVALTNNPRMGIVDNQVNVDDVLNNEIGGIIRMKNPQAIVPISVPFVAAQTLQAIQYMDDAIETKTGVSRASMGLDPDALQNTTATAANITKQAGAAQIEVMSRNLAEGGMKRLFKLMLKLFIENTDEEKMMRMNSQFVPIDPRSWNSSMDVMCNVGLGTGKEDEKVAILQQTLQLQMQIWQTYGPGNGLVSMTLIRNTMADIMALAGVRNSDRYLMPMDAQTEQQLLMMKQQQMAGQPKPLDPGQALVQAEQLKAQAKAQSDMVKMEVDAQKAIAQDDRERDKMDQDLLIKAAEILGKYDTAIDVETIKAAQSEPRYPNERPSGAVSGGRF